MSESSASAGATVGLTRAIKVAFFFFFKANLGYALNLSEARRLSPVRKGVGEEEKKREEVELSNWPGNRKEPPASLSHTHTHTHTSYSGL